jgi:serine/threonine protein kinase
MTQQFGKFLLLKRLALGGMAEIWLAKQLGVQGFEKLVVVKKILDQFASEREFVQMFLDEARLAATLNHPNVVQIYDLGQEGASFYIAMEFIAGHDLLAVLRKCKHAQSALPPAIAARLVAGACEGLHYAHTSKDHQGNPLNLVHRDVSPSNILVTYEGGVKVVDFGIAKAETASTKTEAGKVKGKFSYMSPEQIRSEPLDARSDVFALGIVLYEILVGRRLFKRDNELAIMQDILEGEVRPPSQLRADIPAVLDEIVLKALQKDRRKRFASAQEMQLALERYLSTTPEPPTSVNVAIFMKELFAEEHVAYKALLRELPTARPEQLVHIIEQGHRTGNSQVSGFTDPKARSTEDPASEVEAVRRPSRGRKGLLAGAAIAAVALVGLLTFVLRPSEPPAPVEGELVVETDPPGATVVVDGLRMKVKTPGTLRMLALDKDLQLRFEKEGHEPMEKVVRLSRQAPTKTISLVLPQAQARPGAIEIVTEPPGASVVLDGKPQTGATPLTLSEVPSGMEHLVRVSLAGHQEEAANVKVEAGVTASVKLTLKSLTPPEPEPPAAPEPVTVTKKGGKRGGATAEVEISSTPAADILHAGKKLGRTPATVKLPVGKVALTLVNGELDLRQTVSVNVDGKGKTRSSFSFQKGKIAADATPWADVYIGEKKLGTTPLAPREVYEGSYTLRLVNSELGAIKTVKVVVQAGRTTVVRERLE